MVAEMIDDVGGSGVFRRGRKTTGPIPLQEGKGAVFPSYKRVNMSNFRSPSGTSFVTWKHNEKSFTSHR